MSVQSFSIANFLINIWGIVDSVKELLPGVAAIRTARSHTQ